MSHLRSLITGTAVLVCLAASGVETQSLGDRLRQGADAVKEGATGIAGRAEDTIGSTVDLFTDEATPQQTRVALGAMATETLAELFAGTTRCADALCAERGSGGVRHAPARDRRCRRWRGTRRRGAA
jgi:hypothetical protein